MKNNNKDILNMFFGLHHVRGTFYHIVAIVFLFSMILWGLGFISDSASTIISAILFILDYLAEMYDPHPDNPGPWFKSHFHKFFEKDMYDK